MRAIHIFAAFLAAAHALSYGAPKVRVQVFEEALCPGCVGYFTVNPRGVWAAYSQLHDIMDLSVFMWGNARGDAAAPTCQHGPVECYGNAVWACAHHIYAPSQALPFLECFDAALVKTFPKGLPMGTVNQSFATAVYKSCATRAGLDWDKIEVCRTSDAGVGYLRQDRDATPFHRAVPFIIVNAESYANSTSGPPRDLVSAICKQYTGPLPKACLSAMDSVPSPSNMAYLDPPTCK